MKQLQFILIGAVALKCALCTAADYYVSPLGAGVPPFSSWDSAATNIQEAIDAASAGDVVWVTNGIYAAGGRVMGGDLTNRVALTKALTVQSVNGPKVTTIQGAWDPTSTNGPLAVRCAWLTNGAVLKGFTIQGGATRAPAVPHDPQQSGGGVWGSSSNALVVDCLVVGNSAGYSGGGASRCGLSGCIVSGNFIPGTPVTQYYGGGADSCNLTNCVVSGNFSAAYGGGADGGILWNSALVHNTALGGGGGLYGGRAVNCTISANSVGGSSIVPSPLGGGASGSFLTNCIVYGNRGGSYSNCYAATLSYCCAAPLPTGPGNISSDPLLLPDSTHLSANSPCLRAGLASVVSGSDIDGQSWSNPPSMGADEWVAAPVSSLPPQATLSGVPPVLSLWALGTGADPLAYWWLKDGVVLEDGPKYGSTHGTKLMVSGFGPTDAGSYQLVVSNAFGICTGAVGLVVVHCVDAAGSSPLPPYSDWAGAATNLQDAIDAAGIGEFVLVTNGLYAAGGRVMTGDLTNRVVVNNSITVSSMSGPGFTVISGSADPATTNGALAVRCLWLGRGAVVNGFALEGGATRASGDLFSLQAGGGVWCVSTNESLVNCLLSNNAAAYFGGGSYQGRLQRCVVCANSANQGGGVFARYLSSCAVMSNSASSSGGGAYGSALVNSTVMANRAPPQSGGGVTSGSAKNSIIYNNYGGSPPWPANDWNPGTPTSFASCWTTTGPSDIYTVSPQVLPDNIHLAATSLCRGAGNSLYAAGTDFDGEGWLSPPSMGCDEYYAADYTGPLSVGPITSRNLYGSGGVLRNVRGYLASSYSGNADRLTWSFGDGLASLNAFTWTAVHTWTNAGDFTVVFTAYNADNPAGVSTNAIVHVALPDPPLLSSLTLTGSTFSLSFPMQPGVRYYIDEATNLAEPVLWQQLGSVIYYMFGSSTGIVQDVNATNGFRCYRLRVP